jgi:hypothetical protein
MLISGGASLVVVAIIAVGFRTGHEAVGIFVAVGLLVLTQLVATVLSIRRARDRR